MICNNWRILFTEECRHELFRINELFNAARFTIKFRQHIRAPPNAFDVIKTLEHAYWNTSLIYERQV